MVETSRQGGLANEKKLLRSSWYKAVTISLLLHCLLLLGIGWKATDHTLTPKEDQNLEMEFVPAADEMAVESPLASEATVSDSVPEKKITIDPNKKTPEQPAAQVSGKNTQTLRMTNYSNEQLEATLAKYNLILTLNSPVAIIYHDRGKIYYDKGELDKAFADFSQALALDPLLSPARIGRGFIYINRNQWKLALEDFDQAIATSPKNALAYYGRALCFINNNDKPKAINDLQSVIQYAPPEYKTLIQLAQQKLAELRE